MIFNWLNFKIDLNSFNEFLKSNIQNSDGIIANEVEFNIVEKEQFTQEEVDLINSYYNSLTEIGEQEKINGQNQDS